MADSFKVLVVTPTLGKRETLRETCKSVRDFGGGNVLHVITCPRGAMNAVAEMSGGAEVVEEIAGRGVYGAVNHVLKGRASNYDWVGYINDDDFWLPGMNGLINAAMASLTDDILYGRVLFIDQHGEALMISSCTGRYKSFPLLAARGVIVFTQQAALIRSRLFSSLSGFNEGYRLVADTDFWIRAIRAGAVCHFVDTVCAAFRLQPGQLSADVMTSKDETERMLKQYGLRKACLRGWIEEALFRAENASLYLRRLSERGFKQGLRIREHVG